MSYYEKNRDKLLEKNKLYYEKNRDKFREKRKLRYQKNRDKELLQNKIHYHNNKEYYIKYNKTDKRKKTYMISGWKRMGVIFSDYDLLYEIYENTTHCDLCNVKLESGRKSNGRCLDHDHYITDYENVRNIVCMKCNNQLPKQLNPPESLD